MRDSFKLFLFADGMGSGKDTVADYLVAQYGFSKIALAGGIRQTIRYFSPHGYVDKSDRALEIEVGMQFRRWFDPDVWCRWVTKNQPTGDHIVTDGRFKNEYRYFVERRYIPVKVAATEETRRARLIERDGSVNEDHFRNPADSEIRDFPAKFVLNNDGSLEQLYRQIDDMMRILNQEAVT